MTDLVKTLVVERNGTDLIDQEEIELRAENVFLQDPDFLSDNVLDAMKEALNATAGDVHSSQYVISLSDIVTVDLKKQMRVFQALFVAGSLIVNGQLTVEEG